MRKRASAASELPLSLSLSLSLTRDDEEGGEVVERSSSAFADFQRYAADARRKQPRLCRGPGGVRGGPGEGPPRQSEDLFIFNSTSRTSILPEFHTLGVPALRADLKAILLSDPSLAATAFVRGQRYALVTVNG